MGEIDDYSMLLDHNLRIICVKLKKEIDDRLSNSSSKLYHGAPVWFIDENPIVGYSLKKGGIALLFWSGQSFKESGLNPIGKHKAAEIIFSESGDIDKDRLAIWLAESQLTIWGYKNIVKNKGRLELL